MPLLAVLTVLGCKPPKAKTEASAPVVSLGLPVSVQTVATGTIDDCLPLSGMVAPNLTVNAFPKVAGKLVENKTTEGQTVAQDEIIALVNQDLPGETFKNYQVTAPIAGIVAKVPMDPGSMVGPSVPVATIIDITSVKIAVNVIESDVGGVRKGLAADVTVPAYPDRTFHGSVSNVLPMVDPINHTTKVEVLVPNPGELLKPGMSASVSLRLGTHHEVVIVPRSAIIEKMGERYVYLYDNGATRRANVTTGYQDDVNVEVASGVKAGDRLIVSDLEVLKDGSKVQAKEAQ